jgi:hypothetical protein
MVLVERDKEGSSNLFKIWSKMALVFSSLLPQLGTAKIGIVVMQVVQGEFMVREGSV